MAGDHAWHDLRHLEATPCGIYTTTIDGRYHITTPIHLLVGGLEVVVDVEVVVDFGAVVAVEVVLVLGSPTDGTVDGAWIPAASIRAPTATPAAATTVGTAYVVVRELRR
jgi:hypothetical protein